MAQPTILGPFFAMVPWALLVWVYTCVRRIHFITANDISATDLAVPRAREASS